MYEVISKMLNKSIEGLIEIEEVSVQRGNIPI